MGTTMNKRAYTELIEDDINFLEKLLPGTHLVKDHIIAVLKHSIRMQYPDEDNKDNIYLDKRKAN